MARQQYGKTWWGQFWLNALSHIDEENRLPRGKTYANKGAVLSVEVKKGTISAEVAGTRPKPYKVTLDVPVEQSLGPGFVQKLKDKPLITSQLLNREFDPELNRIATESGIKLFPATWRDLDMHCNCPDFAVPCKHIAAVLYVMANEIDANPLILFKLRGIDISGLVGKGSKKDELPNPIPHFEDLFSDKDEGLEEIVDMEDLLNLDYSTIAKNSPQPTRLLKAEPIFHPKDFKKTLETLCKDLQKWMQSHSMEVNEEEEEEDRAIVDESEYIYTKQINLYFDEPGSFEHMEDETGDYEYPIASLALFLSHMDERRIELASYDWLVLYEIFLFSRRLAETGQFIPKLYQCDTEEYRICWQPFRANPDVMAIYEVLEEALDPDMLMFGHTCQMSRADSLDQLCNLFIQHFFNQMLFKSGLPINFILAYNEDRVFRLFFDPEPVKFAEAGGREIPGSVAQWLKVYENFSEKHRPLINIEEHGQGMRLTLMVEDTEDALSRPVPLNELFTEQKYDGIRPGLLQSLNVFYEHYPLLRSYIANRGEEPLSLSMQEAARLLFEALPMIEMYGIRAMMPKALRNILRPKARMELKSKDTVSNSLMDLASVLQFDWQVAIGNESMDINSFYEKVQGLHGLVKINDQYVYIDPKELATLDKKLTAPPKVNPLQLLQSVITEEFEGQKLMLSPGLRKTIDRMLSDKDIAVPGTLQGQLRPYQLRGYQWLVKNTELGMGCILADDMGLGKTIQVISFLLYLSAEGKLKKRKALIVVPTTLLTNWQHELQRFAPTLSVGVYHGLKRYPSMIGKNDITLTSYGLLRNDLKHFSSPTWQVLVIDEAQNIKNNSTAQTKAVKKVKAHMRIAMSGTPVENRLMEYWSIFDFTNKGYLNKEKRFKEEFARPIHLSQDKKKAELFRKATAPFIIRRLKTDKSIISDLPDKVENNIYSQLSEDQAAIYQSVVDENLEQIKQSDGIARRGLVLKLLTSLKQIGNHPVQFLKKGRADAAQSGKAETLLSIIGQILDSNEKLLLFTQYKEMGQLLEQMIHDRFKKSPLFLHGGTTRNKRDEMVKRFQTDPMQAVFILSLKAGGTGLNLTAASHVIHYDLWWNPAVENQATDRAYRIGQNKNVMVHRLINTGTIEERIDKMLREKSELAKLTVQSGEKWIGELNNHELDELVKLQKAEA